VLAIVVAALVVVVVAVHVHTRSEEERVESRVTSLAENGAHVPARTEDRQGLSKKIFWRMPLYLKIAIISGLAMKDQSDAGRNI
jgi:hypothetical protein